MVWGRAIIHVDLDAFYASVEQLRDPSLRGRPVVVGGGRDADGKPVLNRGVVSAASYEAREFGIRSAMPLTAALRRCPEVIVVPVDMAAYRNASREVFEILHQYTPQIEPLSLDEAFLDVTGSQRRFGSPEVIGVAIRDRIAGVTSLNASLGIATCKVVAKVASDLRKPRGFVVVPPGEEAAVLNPLPLRALPGLGPATENALEGLGIATLGELAALPVDIIRRRVGGGHGQQLWERAQGIDAGEVTVPGIPRSISREETFDSDIMDADRLRSRLRALADDVGRRLRAQSLRARTVSIKLRYSDFSTITRQRSLNTSAAEDATIRGGAVALLDGTWTGQPVRLLGVGVSGFETATQLDIFGAASSPASTGSRLDDALDSLRNRFGERAVQRGAEAALRDLDFRGDDVRHRVSE